MNDHEDMEINSNAIMKKAVLALEKDLCDNCLGRLFARAGYGLTNEERGKAVRIMLALSLEDIDRSGSGNNSELMKRIPVHYDLENIESSDEKKKPVDDESWVNEPTMKFMGHLSQEIVDGSCWLCNDIFDRIPEMVKLLVEKNENQEFQSYQIGTKMDPSTLERERTLWERVEPSNAEPLKEELNREVGKSYAEAVPGKDFERNGADVVFIIDPIFNTVEVKIKPLFIYGRYEKLVRGIPQTRWICKTCGGKGCRKCQDKGRMYETSVEEEIGNIIAKETLGSNFKLHGKGREDVDVRCIGRGRPFIIEITEPKKRYLDLQKLQDMINNKKEKKVNVHGLKWSTRKEVPEIKKGDTYKRYSAIISSPNGLDEENLKYKVQLLAHRSISQRTPRRVSHRRADLVRERRVHEISFEMIDGGRAKVDLLTDGGLYIKELFHGDQGRTEPNLSSLLGKEVNVDSLDVTDVMEEKDPIPGVKENGQKV